MAILNFFTQDRDVLIEKNKVIVITQRTIRFSGNVWQTHNVVGFNEEHGVNLGTIHYGIIVCVFIIGVIISSFNVLYGWLVVSLSILGIVRNISKPKYYGLAITLSSGDKFLFVTNNRVGLRTVISVIYDFFELKQDLVIEITINDNGISIKTETGKSYAVSGNIFAAAIEGNDVAGWSGENDK